MSSTESSATRQAGRYNWIILRRVKRYGLRMYSVLPSIFYLRSKSIAHSPWDYSHSASFENLDRETKPFYILQGQERQQTHAI